MTPLAALTLTDLDRAQRLMAHFGVEVDPQVHCVSPAGDWWIGLTLPDEVAERTALLALLSDWMAINLVSAFTIAAELSEPPAMICIGVSFSETVAGISQTISRSPLAFGKPAWLGRDQIGDDVPSLLPRGRRELSLDRLVEVEEVFGPEGEFEAIRLTP